MKVRDLIERSCEWKAEQVNGELKITMTKYIGNKKKAVIPFGFMIARDLRQLMNLLQNGTIEDVLEISEFRPAWKECGYVSGIAESAFEDNDTVEEIWLPDTITHIGENAFRSCTALKRVYFYDAKRRDAEIEYGHSENDDLNEEIECSFARNKIVSVSKLESIPDGMFEFCERLESFDYAKDVQTIGKRSFYGCKKIEKIELPESLEEIPAEVFAKCEKLKSIRIPAQVREIGAESFSECKSLESIEIPGDVSRLEEGAFYYCTGLKNIKLPCKIREIGNACFRGCASLEEIQLPACLEEIGVGAFACCVNLREITIPMSVEEIGDSAFNGCTSLKKVRLPEVVGSIGAYVFKDCESLLECELPYNMQFVANGLFQKCYSLQNVHIQDGVRSIGSKAFYECRSLKTLKVPATVRIIEKNAFERTFLVSMFLPKRFETEDIKEYGIDYEQTDVEWIY